MSEEGPEGRPRRKKKKRRREIPVEAVSLGNPVGVPQTPPLSRTADAAGSAPAFARGWPEDDALDALVAAFEAGDYGRVRREAPKLAKRTESDAVRRAARELAQRIEPDPLAAYLLAAAAMLLAFLAGWYWSHPHHP